MTLGKTRRRLEELEVRVARLEAMPTARMSRQQAWRFMGPCPSFTPGDGDVCATCARPRSDHP